MVIIIYSCAKKFAIFNYRKAFEQSEKEIK